MQAIDRRETPALRPTWLRWLVVHRVSLANEGPGNLDPIPDHLLTGELLAQRFTDRGLGTGGRTPYHALIRLDSAGTVDHLLRLGVAGAHASGYNWCTLAVACVGDTTQRPLTQPQTMRLVDVATSLLPLAGGRICGHTDLPRASADPNKQCPGHYLDLHTIERCVLFRLPDGWQEWTFLRRLEHAQAAGWEL